MAQWLTLDEAAGLVFDRAKVALAGAGEMSPLGLVKALIRRRPQELHLVATPTGGFALELLCAAGMVRTVEAAQVSLNELGLAPAFRKGVEEGRIKVLDHA